MATNTISARIRRIKHEAKRKFLGRPPLRISIRGGFGMFSVVNCIVNAAKRYEDGKLPMFAIDDRNFIFGRWDDHFAAPLRVADAAPVKIGVSVGRFNNEFQTGRKPIPPRAMVGYDGPRDWGSRSILLPPTDRQEAGRIIAKYLRLRPDLKSEIDAEIALSGIADKLALHIRGPGRSHGGVGWMLFRMGHRGVPYESYFEAADAWLDRNDTGIHVFSDAREVIDKVVARYGRRATFRAGSLISDRGEGHLDRKPADKCRMGRDIIIECWMMARARHLIHGNSNVTNFAQSLNPDLSHFDIFERFYQPDDVGVGGSRLPPSDMKV